MLCRSASYNDVDSGYFFFFLRFSSICVLIRHLQVQQELAEEKRVFSAKIAEILSQDSIDNEAVSALMLAYTIKR